jgi:hypothetical protein
MKAKQIIITILFLFTMCSCDKKEDRSIKSIYVLYYNYCFEAPLAIDCNGITKRTPSMKKGKTDLETALNRMGVLDCYIENKIILKDINEEIRRLRKDTTRKVADARISCLIRYYSGKEEKLCISGYFAEDIFYNGQFQKQNNKLLFLIKNSIKYYSWMNGNNYLRFQEELKDKSINRSFVKDIFGKSY